MLTPHIPRALRLFIAAYAALVLAYLLGLHNPYWAAMPVFVVMQPNRQDLLLRGVFRMVGTLIGGGIGLAALLYIDNPHLIAAVLVVVVALSASIAYWIGTIYAYATMLVGITCVVIIIPGLSGHAEPVPLAVDRVWCTLIGVVAVTLTTFFSTPPRKESAPLRADHSVTASLARFVTAGGIVAIAMAFLNFAGGMAAWRRWGLRLARAYSRP